MKKEERIAYDSDRIRVYERDQELYDGSKKVFVRAERVSTALILPVHHDKILLSIQEQPHREFPYRSHIWWVVEWWENPLSAAKRELSEETGFSSQSFEQYRYASLWKQINQKKYVYIAKWLEKVSKISLDAWEKIELKWISIDEYIDLLIHKKCGGTWWREEVMLKIIDWTIDDFKKSLFSC